MFSAGCSLPFKLTTYHITATFSTSSPVFYCVLLSSSTLLLEEISARNNNTYLTSFAYTFELGFNMGLKNNEKLKTNVTQWIRTIYPRWIFSLVMYRTEVAHWQWTSFLVYNLIVKKYTKIWAKNLLWNGKVIRCTRASAGMVTRLTTTNT